MKKNSIFLVLSLLLCGSSFAQQSQIRDHITNVFEENCVRRTLDIDILRQDVLFSIELIDSMVRLDTFYHCTKERVLPTSFSLLNFADSSNYEKVMAFLIRYLNETSISNKEQLLNNLVSIIWSRHIRSFDRLDYFVSNTAKKFVGSPLFYQSTSGHVPLFISYLGRNQTQDINDLKEWGKLHNVSGWEGRMLKVALFRLEEPETVSMVQNSRPKTDCEWREYFLMLDFARNESAVSILISLFEDENVYENFIMEAYASIPFYSTVRSSALYVLSKMIEDFPIGRKWTPPASEDRSNVPNFPEEYFEKVRQFLKEGEFIINRRPDFLF